MNNKNKIFTWVFYLSIVLVLILFALQKVHDTDVWLHLGIGKYIVEHRALPPGDVFTYTSYGQPYQYFEWLFQAGLYLLYYYAGYHGLMVFKLVLWLLTMGLLWLWMRTEGMDSRWAAFFSIFPAYLLAMRWKERPEIVGYFCIVLYLVILSLFRCKRHNYFYFLPWVQIILINSHPSALLGISIYGIILVGEAINYFWDKNKGETRVIKALVVMIPLLVLASLVNPYGYKLLLEPFFYSAIMAQKKMIFEWWPIWAFKDMLYLYLAFLIPAALSFIPRFYRPRENIKILDLLLFLFSALIPLVSVRYLVVFAILALPLAGKNFYWFFSCWEGGRRLWSRGRQSVPWAPWALPVLVLLWGGIFIACSPVGGILGWGAEELVVPEKAVAFIQSYSIPGPVFNSYEWGGYMMLEAYPRYLAYIDSRGHYLDVFKEYQLIMGAKDNWQKRLELRGVNLIISRALYLGNGAIQPLILALIKDPDWILIWNEGCTLVFIKNRPENQKWIQLFAFPKNRIFNEIIFEGWFFINRWRISNQTYNSLGWAYLNLGNFKAAQTAYQEQLKIDPQHENARRNLELLIRQGY